MQKIAVLGAVLATALAAAPVAAQSDGATPNPVYKLSASPVSPARQDATPALRLSETHWALPAEGALPVQPDKTAVILNKLLTVDDHVRLSPSGDSVIDVPRPDGADKPKGAYLNLKIDW